MLSALLPDFNPHPHTEDDFIRQLYFCGSLHFNPHPHTEDDAIAAACQLGLVHFNPHPHTEDDLPRHGLTGTPVVFQSTSSHGG